MSAADALDEMAARLDNEAAERILFCHEQRALGTWHSVRLANHAGLYVVGLRHSARALRVRAEELRAKERANALGAHRWS